jgi:hypothetical protein
MKKLFLDDIRIPKDCANGLVPSHLNKFYWENEWNIVRSHNEFVDWINKNGLPDFISFDHDLADVHYTMDFSKHFHNQGTEKTGYDSAKWLGDYCIDSKCKLPNFVVHSQNPVGKANIQGYLDNVKRFLSKI